MTATADTIDLEKFRTLVPISALRDHNLTRLHARARLFAASPGENIFEHGQRDGDSIYLIAGELEFVDPDGAVQSALSASSPDALHRVGHRIPRPYTARATTPVSFLRVDTSLLDVLITSDQTGTFEVVEVGDTEDSAGDDSDWMAAVLQNRLFQRLPPEKLQAMFMRMEQLEVNHGDIVIKQNDPGDFFYVMVRGRCGVFRDMPGRQHPLKVAELQSGACFGEDALISDSPRNATVVMLEPGVLMRLSKTDFHSLLANSFIKPLSAAQAKQQVAGGEARWLDVRMPNEFANTHLEGAVNIPLFLLRAKLGTLDKQQRYVVYCDGGHRSMVAAFILERNGFQVQFLKDGLAGC